MPSSLAFERNTAMTIQKNRYSFYEPSLLPAKVVCQLKSILRTGREVMQLNTHIDVWSKGVKHHCLYVTLPWDITIRKQRDLLNRLLSPWKIAQPALRQSYSAWTEGIPNENSGIESSLCQRRHSWLENQSSEAELTAQTPYMEFWRKYSSFITQYLLKPIGTLQQRPWARENAALSEGLTTI